MKLSLCIAVYNEEKNLHYPMDCAIDIADEVIIVDGGSIDRTIEVAKSYGKKVTVINSDNPIMFHKNKQKAIEAAKGEWILQLDADEELTPELIEEIKIITNDELRINDKPVAYNIPRKNFFLTRFLMKGGQYPDYTIRLYKNGVAKFPCRNVHENVEIIKLPPAPYNLQPKIGFLKNPLLHYADPDFSRYLMRWDRYTTLEVENMKFVIRNPQLNLNYFNYFIVKPCVTFFLMYFRHKGFMDGFPGFVFALFSSIRFWVIYIKWITKSKLRS
ncbi:MAG: glycosyltransferase family 2 protein [Patescibacteria group bacterium]